MPDRDDLVRRALVDAAAPRPLAPATRDRLAALVRDDADERVAALLREAAAPRALPAPALTALRARLAGGVPARRRIGGLRPRVTLSLLSAAAAAVLVVAVLVALGPADAPAPVARPAPTGAPTASPSGSRQPALPPSTPPPPTATVAPGVGGVAGPDVPRPSGGPTAASPSAMPRPGNDPAGEPGAPAAPGGPGAPAWGPQPQRSVSGVAPRTGPVAGGTVVTVRGSGLSAAVRVEVGGRRAGSLRVESDSELTAETPAGMEAGRVPVVVVMADGSRYGLSPGFTYVAAPVLDAISPERGPTAGGNVVVLSGEHFHPDAVVRFGTARAEVREVTPTSIEVVAPGHAVGTVEVTVSTPGGTSGGRRYTYLPA